MESGPARLFTKEQLTIPSEPPLADGYDKVEVPNLDETDSHLAQIEQDLTDAHTFLNGVAEDFKVNIGGVQTTLDTELASPAEDVPQYVRENMAVTQQAIDGAESSFLPDAYTENPPWYQPASDEIPTSNPEDQPHPKGPQEQ
jgi:hypothetical protein